MDELKQGVTQVANQLYQQHGSVRASELVAAAKPKDSPAHNAFEWDNKKAGSEYRLMQARQWLRKIEIIIEDRGERLIHVPLIVNEEGDSREGYYRPLSLVQSNDDEYSRAFASAITQLNAAKRAFNELQHKTEKETKPMKKAAKGFQQVESAYNEQRALL